jgi:hypothetical protein
LGLKYFSDNVPDLSRLSWQSLDNQFDHLVEERLREKLINDIGDEIESHVPCGRMSFVVKCKIDPKTSVKRILKNLSIIVGQEQKNL